MKEHEESKGVVEGLYYIKYLVQEMINEIENEQVLKGDSIEGVAIILRDFYEGKRL